MRSENLAVRRVGTLHTAGRSEVDLPASCFEHHNNRMSLNRLTPTQCIFIGIIGIIDLRSRCHHLAHTLQPVKPSMDILTDKSMMYPVPRRSSYTKYNPINDHTQSKL